MSRTTAIMQPYVFPYLGYFCLVQASDAFVFYDDVNFINRGWINRNRILINGQEHRFTIPLANPSQNRLISEVRTHNFPEFKKKLLRQIEHAYGKSKFFETGMSYVDFVLSDDFDFISDLAIRSVEHFSYLMGLKKTFMRSSACFASSKGLDRADRLIEIAQELDSSNYVNAPGGAELYDKEYFAQRGMNLAFVRPKVTNYEQARVKEFVPNLSIIDVLMNNDYSDVRRMLDNYELV